jgi:hypothetical protein
MDAPLDPAEVATELDGLAHVEDGDLPRDARTPTRVDLVHAEKVCTTGPQVGPSATLPSLLLPHEVCRHGHIDLLRVGSPRLSM